FRRRCRGLVSGDVVHHAAADAVAEYSRHGDRDHTNSPDCSHHSGCEPIVVAGRRRSIAVTQMITAHAIQEGLVREEFFLEYLPTVSLNDGRCVGAEALA